MPMAEGVATPSDRPPMVIPMQPSPIPETFAKDAIIGWFRGEFAAANAIIDSLCNHLTQIDGIGAGDHGSEYESVFAALHRRRLNWIPVIQMQKYFSIADVAVELRRVADKKMNLKEEEEENKSEEIKVVDVEREISDEESKQSEVAVKEDSTDGKVDEGGFQEQKIPPNNIQICSNHENCELRRSQIKMTKGFVAKEQVKGHMVNVVKGLKLYEDIFTNSELSKISEIVNELRLAGHNGKLSGETFILFNQQLKGNKKELIQFGVPIFGKIKDEAERPQQCNIEPIPSALQTVIDHLVQWHLIPESRKPNSCIINFFDEGEYSQPYLKPPHLDQPISTLLLSETEMAFGRVLVRNHHGNFKGPLMISLKEGSLLVMHGNSASMARHVMCPSPNKRASITFFRVRPDTNEIQPSIIPPPIKAMTVWQPGVLQGPQPYSVPNRPLNGYDSMEVVPKWGVHAPVFMLAPVQPMVMGPQGMPCSGTGVFLPWTVGTKTPAKHLPQHSQRARLLTLPSPIEAQVNESTSNPATNV